MISLIIGKCLNIMGMFIFFYYTAWLFFSQYLSDDNQIKKIFFMNIKVAVYLPYCVLIVGLLGIGFFLKS